MIKLRHLAAASAVVLTLAVARAARVGAVDRLRPDQLQPERADRRARAAADQQPDHDVDQPGDEPGQPGAQSRQPADVDADPASVVDRPDPVAARPGAEHRLQRPAHRAGLFDELRFGRRHRFDHRHGRQRADPLAELGRRLRGQPEGSGGRGRQHPDQLQRHDLAGLGQPERHRRACRRPRPATSSWRCNPSSSPTSSPCCRPRAGPTRWSRRVPPRPRRRASRTTRPSRRAPAISPATSPCSAATEAPRCWDGRRSSAPPRSSP